MTRQLLLTTAALSLAAGAFAQDGVDDAEWDVTNPPGDKKTISIDVSAISGAIQSITFLGGHGAGGRTLARASAGS